MTARATLHLRDMAAAHTARQAREVMEVDGASFWFEKAVALPSDQATPASSPGVWCSTGATESRGFSADSSSTEVGDVIVHTLARAASPTRRRESARSLAHEGETRGEREPLRFW